MSDDMKETAEVRPSLLVDKEAGERYKQVVEAGRKLFRGSALCDSAREVTQEDFRLAIEFHKELSPTNPKQPFRIKPRTTPWSSGEIIDWSTFADWETPGRTLEHVNIASHAAAIIVRELQQNLREPNDSLDEWARKASQEIEKVSPYHAAAAAALHDAGRLVTHLGYTNERIGRALLTRMGIRRDIVSLLPDESIMQLLPDKDMGKAIQSLPTEAVIIRMADDFGRRYFGTQRLVQPSDITSQWMQAWGDKYMKEQPTGRPSESFWRKEIEVSNPDGSKQRITRMQLHINNAQRYIEALDKWVQSASTLTLSDLTRTLNEEIAPLLPPLNERIPTTSKDLLDNQLLGREIRVATKRLKFEALTAKGGLQKILTKTVILLLLMEQQYKLS